MYAELRLVPTGREEAPVPEAETPLDGVEVAGRE